MKTLSLRCLKTAVWGVPFDTSVSGLMVMKEGNRRSDEQMFEVVDFDLLVRKAIGQVNLSDLVPSLEPIIFFAAVS